MFHAHVLYVVLGVSAVINLSQLPIFSLALSPSFFAVVNSFSSKAFLVSTLVFI